MQMINELRLQIEDMENEEYKLDIIKIDLGMNSVNLCFNCILNLIST